ncbi:hypothetical protein CAPTEDRAFT_197271 [Capitella teleta]|uniref:Uncharacterized protein n=1 Tax=Capitella teleta TaxID=283909 RepID=R7T9Y8_CAPTE|nr:hypothetical protein CAPTEDRAFT_197271 [Capitella teleta]|eukprot:ELT90529.1 hypothetical protein CAPTEDRAFT_197271 [Capitella teleta]
MLTRRSSLRPSTSSAPGTSATDGSVPAHPPHAHRVHAEIHPIPRDAPKPTPNPTKEQTKVRVSTGKGRKNMFVSVEAIKGIHKRIDQRSNPLHNRSLSDSQLSKSKGHLKKRQKLLQIGRRAMASADPFKRRDSSAGSKIPIRHSSGNAEPEQKEEDKSKRRRSEEVRRPLSSTPRKDEKLLTQVRKLLEEKSNKYGKSATPDSEKKAVARIEECFKSPGGTATSAIASPLSVLQATEVKDPSDLVKTTPQLPIAPEGMERVLEGQSENTVMDVDVTQEASRKDSSVSKESADNSQKRIDDTEDDLYNEALVPDSKYRKVEQSTVVSMEVTEGSNTPVEAVRAMYNLRRSVLQSDQAQTTKSPVLIEAKMFSQQRKRSHQLPWAADSFREVLDSSTKCKKFKQQWAKNTRNAKSIYTVSDINFRRNLSRRRTLSESTLDSRKEDEESDGEVFVDDKEQETAAPYSSPPDVFKEPSQTSSTQWTSTAVERAIQMLEGHLDTQKQSPSQQKEAEPTEPPPVIAKRRRSDSQCPPPMGPTLSERLLPKRSSVSGSTPTLERPPSGGYDTASEQKPPPVNNLAAFLRRTRPIPSPSVHPSESSTSRPEPPASFNHPWPPSTTQHAPSDSIPGLGFVNRKPDWSLFSGLGNRASSMASDSFNPLMNSVPREGNIPFFFPQSHQAPQYSPLSSTHGFLQEVHHWLEKSRECHMKAVDTLTKHILSASEVIQSLQKELELERVSRIRMERMLRDNNH